VRVRAQDRFGNPFEVIGKADGTRAFCHEADHLEALFLPLSQSGC
jgi:peptide deformylase